MSEVELKIRLVLSKSGKSVLIFIGNRGWAVNVEALKSLIEGKRRLIVPAITFGVEQREANVKPKLETRSMENAGYIRYNQRERVYEVEVDGKHYVVTESGLDGLVNGLFSRTSIWRVK